MTVVIFLAVIVAAFICWRLLRRTKVTYRSDGFGGAHDCGPRALLTVMPTLSHERIREAFNNCSDKWPYGGITNVEFTTALRYLDVFDLFSYNAEDDLKISDFLDNNKFSVLLIHGHFTVVKDSKIYDTPNYVSISPKTHVYCAWTLN